jgi:hypothetical protein
MVHRSTDMLIEPVVLATMLFGVLAAVILVTVI